MPAATRAARRARARAGAAALALRVFEQRDLLTPILRSAASSNGLLVTKRVARDAPDVALAVRKLIWQGRILKGTAILEGHTDILWGCGRRAATRRRGSGTPRRVRCR
jgi:hypothetical protein